MHRRLQGELLVVHNQVLPGKAPQLPIPHRVQEHNRQAIPGKVPESVQHISQRRSGIRVTESSPFVLATKIPVQSKSFSTTRAEIQ